MSFGRYRTQEVAGSSPAGSTLEPAGNGGFSVSVNGKCPPRIYRPSTKRDGGSIGSRPRQLRVEKNVVNLVARIVLRNS